MWGTPSHVVDPKTPGAVDTIVHLGDCWHAEDIVPHKQDIIRYNQRISSFFASAYRYLAAAAQVYADSAAWSAQAAAPVAQAALQKLAETYLQPLAAAGAIPGSERKLFLTAITPSGVVCHVPSFQEATLCVLKGDGFVTSPILHVLRDSYQKKGYAVETFYSPLNPKTQIDHLYIPSLSLLFATHDVINQFPLPQNAPVLSLEIPLSDDDEEKCNQNTMALLQLLDLATQTIQKAKSVHDLLETCYVPHMDFNQVEQIKNQILHDLALD